ncbi:Interleukin-like EMT inducer [Thermodesulfobium acidiphilum]|uniref:Interleukin-like EMT inducer n=1 Tax=Thermodesulfobium acidiphilum TaxID=1794699 RepID=A0A2R4W0A3_THEAF|nr:interleukin-like EMT inducer domain-containing protein [Thermodesulfobium acidiphilum]AWB10241.1 Interleukin-like EMT inducer [Thermodesulfobium acidiphilum]
MKYIKDFFSNKVFRHLVYFFIFLFLVNFVFLKTNAYSQESTLSLRLGNGMVIVLGEQSSLSKIKDLILTSKRKFETIQDLADFISSEHISGIKEIGLFVSDNLQPNENIKKVFDGTLRDAIEKGVIPYLPNNIKFSQVREFLESFGYNVIFGPGVYPFSDKLKCEVKLASYGLKSGSYIEINWKKYIPKKLGYFLIAIDPNNGKIISEGNFNTSFHHQENAALVNYLQSVPKNAFLLGVINIEAMRKMDSDSYTLLNQMGLHLVPFGYYGYSHAFILDVKEKKALEERSSTISELYYVPPEKLDESSFIRLINKKPLPTIYLDGLSPDSKVLVFSLPQNRRF